MNAKIIRLDRFSTPDQPLRRLTEVDLAVSYDRGLAEGMRLAEETTLAMLSGQVQHLQSTLALNDEQAREIRRQTIQALAPVLQEIVALLAPASRSERITSALRTELDRLVDDASPRTCTITCGPDLGDAVRDSLPPESAYLRVVISDHHQETAEIHCDGGVIRFDDAAMIKGITALINDILHEV